MAKSIKDSGIFGFGRSGVSLQGSDLVLDLNKITEPLVFVPAVNLDDGYNEQGHCLVTYNRFSFANPFKESKDDGRTSYLYFPDLNNPEANYGELIAGEEARPSFRFLMPAFVVVGDTLQARVITGGRPAFNQLDASDQNMKGKRLTYKDANGNRRVAKRKGFKGVTFTITKTGKSPKYVFNMMREDERYKFNAVQTPSAFDGERLNTPDSIFEYLTRNGVPPSLLNGDINDVEIDDTIVTRALDIDDMSEIENTESYHEEIDDSDEDVEIEDFEVDEDATISDDEEFNGIPF